MLVELSIGRRPADCVVDVDFIFERSMPEPNTGCWIWLGGYSSGKCPSMGFEGRTEKVSRVSFEIANAPLAILVATLSAIQDQRHEQ